MRHYLNNYMGLKTDLLNDFMDTLAHNKTMQELKSLVNMALAFLDDRIKKAANMLVESSSASI